MRLWCPSLSQHSGKAAHWLLLCMHPPSDNWLRCTLMRMSTHMRLWCLSLSQHSGKAARWLLLCMDLPETLHAHVQEI